MKNIVIDTNVLFSALLARNFDLRVILMDDSYRFYSVKYMLVEIFKHKERILSKSKAPESDIYDYLNELLQRIEFVNEAFVSLTNYSKAHILCRDIDENDTPFVALALELGADLWTRDDKLKNHLIGKGFTSFF